MKTEIYSWRVSPETKNALEEESRRSGVSLASLLDRITREWLEQRQSALSDDEAEQRRLHAEALKHVGTLSGGNPRRSKQVRSLVRERLKTRRAR